jgi:hypothetical protein
MVSRKTVSRLILCSWSWVPRDLHQDQSVYCENPEEG